METRWRSFSLVRKLPCDIQVGDHSAQFQMYEQYERLKQVGRGGPNPFIDPSGCNLETDILKRCSRPFSPGTDRHDAVSPLTDYDAPWHFLNLTPLPHGQGSLRPT